MRVILPGSYDPVTLGHLEVIRRAAREHEEVYVVIFVNPEKEYTFSLDDRMRMLMLATDEFDNVLVSNSQGLVIDYMREHDIEKIVKGYRNDADLEYERRQAEWNMRYGGYETELQLASEEYSHISSTLARERIREGGDLTGILPESVISYLRERDK
ncbi:MAG: pantetheine-phosphate adenylyltransferase [Clostridia bacterium]|nr:pantetheine-phosphate adenylyltransferase [Clostridia bacterium]